MRVFAWAAVILLWAIVIPLAFATLYSTIELQAAARSASKGDALATFHTIALARQLDGVDKPGVRNSIVHNRHAALLSLFQARSTVRAEAIDLLAAHGVHDATSQCTAPPADLKACQIDNNLAACTTDWLRISGCFETASQLASRDRSAQPALALMKSDMKGARDRGFAFNSYSLNLQELNKIEGDPYFPVSDALRNSRLPLTRTLFVLPQGVVVACFTSLMAALGAVVSALIKLPAAPAGGYPIEAILRTFVVAPIIGAVAGFMVYFVVSAGTAFLIQPAAADATQAVNNLSAPALASLGIFAGLAADSAIKWLESKASSFFKV
jgi:hypothetical protein